MMNGRTKDTLAGFLFIGGLMLFFFFVGYTIASFPYAEASIIKEFEQAIVIITSASSIIPEASAYPYSYYQPFDTSLGYWDSGYYERPAYDYFDNFAYYNYDERPNYWEHWEFSIDWEDPDNWSSTTGLPIIKNYNYIVTRQPIIAFDPYSTPIVIYPQCQYWVDTFIYGC